MSEAKVIEEIIKPEFSKEIEANITGVQNIEDNIKEVQEFAIKLSEYYQGLKFSEEQLKEAKEEMANINKFKAKVSDFRKEIEKQWKAPLETFLNSAKETEKLLTDTYKTIQNEISVYEVKQLEEIKEKVESYFNEYAESKKIDFIKFEDMNMNITKGLITTTGNLAKKTVDSINEFIDGVEKDINLINTLEHKEEIIIEYKKDLKCANAIANVQDRYKQLEEAKIKENEPLNDEIMVNKIDEVLQAPKEIANVEVQEEIFQMTFTVKGTKEQLKELKKYLEEKGLI